VRSVLRFVPVTASNTPADTPSPALEAVRVQREGLRAASDALERAAASPAPGRAEEWVELVAERLTALERAFARHVEATEGPGSLFDEVVGRAPRLARQVDRLRADHVAINEALGRVAAMTSTAGRAERADVDTIRAEVLGLLGRVAHHRSTGADLLYEAYWVDVEASD